MSALSSANIGGLELGRALRPLLGPSVRMVAVTGYGHAEVRKGAVEAGFDAYVVKPVSEDSLEHERRLAGEVDTRLSSGNAESA
jgi:CheY-like chemotaxis protein